jgi:asparagine synthase (glutamine-hydrolysing)
MCGIFGAIGRLPDGALDRVSLALRHRGPDSEGRFVDGEVALLHRRLKIIDLSDAASQPMANEDGSVQVVFNGEIYNHRALRPLLEGKHRFRSRSDTEVIVHGYEEWGDEVVDRLDGMFAFAVWDRTRRRLLLARDRTGKKPLFFSAGGDTFRFGSSIASLHASGLPEGIAVEPLPLYLAYGFVPPPATLHAGVLQLPPASRLVYEPGREPRIDEYWRPHFGEGTPAFSYEDASLEVRKRVTSAVEHRLESDVPLGAFLSGGIDSTIIVGTMARLMGGRVRTFSIGFSGDARYDETAYARIAARAFGTEHTEFTLEPSSFELVETLVQHHDGPFGDSSAIPTYVVAGLTRKHVTVALTGDGGDELFCGYSRFLAAEAAEKIPQALRGLASRLSTHLPAASSERSLLGRARRFLQASSLPIADRLARWNSFFPEPAALLRADLRATLADPAGAPLAWQRSMFGLGHGRTVLARVLEHNFRTYLPFDLLVKADRTSMAHGLETRSPFLDTQLIEYVSRLPPSYLRRGADTKRILKHAFADLLPVEIRRRGKMGFGVPLGTWFRNDLREYLHDRVGTGARLDAYLDRRAVDRLLDEHHRGAADHGQKLWALLTLEVWLRSLNASSFACAA